MEEISSQAGNGQAHAAPASASRASWGQRLLAWLTALYVLSILAVWALMFGDGDQGWIATLVLFGPRWLCWLPWPFLACAALLWRRGLLWPLAATAVWIAGPFMGLCLHLPSGGHERATLRVMTCNVDKMMIDVDRLADVIVDQQPDVVALQEVQTGTPFEWPPHWFVLERDEFLLASRYPIRMTEYIRRPAYPRDIAIIRYTVETPDREIQVFNVHLRSPRAGLEAILNRRTGIDLANVGKLQAILQIRATESAACSEWVESFAGPKIVLGDFNIPIESTVYRRCWSWLNNAFSQVGWGLGFTKNSEKDGWSYGARIDHVLSNPPWRAVRCWVGADVGSDHLPLLADLEFE